MPRVGTGLNPRPRTSPREGLANAPESPCRHRFQVRRRRPRTYPETEGGVARRPATRLKAIPTSPFLVTLAYPYGPAGPSTPASDAGVTRERLIVLREKRPWVHVRGHGLLLVLAVLVVVLMLAPASVGVTAAASGVPGSAASNSPVALPTAATTSPLGSASTSSGIPGQDPANEPSINPVALAQEQAARPGYQTLLADTHNATLTPPPVTSPAAPHPPVSGAAGRYAGIDYGWITGTVVSSKPPYTPISVAVVSAEPVAGFCPSVGCINVQSGATGAFTVAASIGENEFLVSDASYMTNRTWAYVSTDGYSNVGTIELVEDGFVSGILLGSDPAHEPVSGINVASLSGDGPVFGPPTDYTNGQGRFTVAVPPLPSEITFTPVFPFTPYQPNTTFVNVSSGQSISIGTVYLQRMTEVQVTLVDSTNGLPLDGVLGAIQVCSRATGFCPVQGTRGGGPVEYAQAPVGPDVIHAYMNGYVLNSTALGVVPSVRPGGPAVNMGTVAVVPTGGIQLWVNITGISTPYGSSPPTSIWPVGEFATVSSCNLDGLSASVPTLYNMTSSECTSACVSPGTGNVIEGIPLRNFITVAPDEIGCIQPGYPTWPIPEDMPVFDNWGWVNVTPDKLVNAGGIDLLPGSYIEGEVLPASETGWDVTACSTDEPALCGEGSFADSQYADSYTFGVPNNCPEYPTPAASYTYCVAAPPGPVELRVTASNASANYTWAYNPPLSWPSQPLLLADADQDNSPVINLTLANVVGRVLQSRSLTPVLGLPSIQVCPGHLSLGGRLRRRGRELHRVLLGQRSPGLGRGHRLGPSVRAELHLGLRDAGQLHRNDPPQPVRVRERSGGRLLAQRGLRGDRPALSRVRPQLLQAGRSRRTHGDRRVVLRCDPGGSAPERSVRGRGVCARIDHRLHVGQHHHSRRELHGADDRPRFVRRRPARSGSAAGRVRPDRRVVRGGLGHRQRRRCAVRDRPPQRLHHRYSPQRRDQRDHLVHSRERRRVQRFTALRGLHDLFRRARLLLCEPVPQRQR